MLKKLNDNSTYSKAHILKTTLLFNCNNQEYLFTSFKINHNVLIVNVIVQSLSHVQLFVTPWTAAHQSSLSFSISLSFLKLTSIESVMHPTISSSVIPFSSCLQFLAASGSFLMSQVFASGSQNIGVSA